MVDYVTILGIILTAVIAYVSYQQQQKIIRQQAEEINHQAMQLEELKNERRRELIEKYYPPLAENLRHSLPDIAYTYREGYQKEYGEYLEILVEMANQSTLNIIESLDEPLYSDLKIILDEYIPKEKELENRRNESWNEIPRKWKKWLMDNYTEIPKLQDTSDKFVSQLALSLLWQLWRNEEELVVQNFNDVSDRHFIVDGYGVEPNIAREQILHELTSTAEDEWESIREEYESNLVMLTELLEKRILPRITETLKTLGN